MLDGEEAAFRDFVVARIARLRRVAYLVCGDWHLAEDAVSTALAKLYANWRRASQAESLDAYVRTILLRSLVDERRRPWTRERPTLDLAIADRSGPDQTTAVDDRIVLRGALQALPRRRRAVLVLRYFEDLSVEQTAAALGLSTGTVKSQTARALSALRDALPEGYQSVVGGLRD